MEKFYAGLGRADKSAYYQGLSEHYLAELEKMVITSASPTGQGKGCLPYASQGLVDTGHGWRTPQAQDTCSLAGTAYYLFSYFGYNPLDPQLGTYSSTVNYARE